MLSEIHSARLGQYKKINFNFLKLNEIRDESVKQGCIKIWRQSIKIQSRNVYLIHVLKQNKKTLLKLRAHYGFNCASVYLTGSRFRKTESS